MPKGKKTTTEAAEPTDAPQAEEAKNPQPSMIQVSQEQWDEVQKKLKMLEAVADKGRVFNYEANSNNKQPSKVKLSVHNGQLIVGWRTIKDELVKHPTTGLIVGEIQEYELLLLDKAGNTTRATVNGYPAFSDARYSERVEAELVGKKEDFDGKVTFDVKLDDGRVIQLDSRFVN